MSVENFLSAVLPASGLRFALASEGENGKPGFKPGQRHYPAGDTAALIGYLAAGSSQGKNCYFAVAGFDRVVKPDDPNQWPRRLATAAIFHRCLRLDIDCGPGKDYLDNRVAMKALLQFVADYQLNKPWIVYSGSGFHVYFGFDRDIGLVEWKGLAARLSAATRAAGFKVDPTTTEDAARVLRLPGTLNNKPKWAAMGVTPPVVRILQVGDAADPAVIAAHLPEVDIGEIPGMAFASLPSAILLPQWARDAAGSKDFGSAYADYFLKQVLVQCPGMGAMLRAGGAGTPEPLWKLALQLIHKSGNTEAEKHTVAVAISKGHADFSMSGLETKMTTVRQQDYHPPSCARMAGNGMAECATCPYSGKITSPISLGYPAPKILEQAPVAAVPTEATYAAPVQPAVTPAATPAPPPVMVAGLGAAPPLPPLPAIASLTSPVPQQIGVFVITPGQSLVQVVDGNLTGNLLIVNGKPTLMRKPKEEGGQPVPITLLPYSIVGVERTMAKDMHGASSITLMLDAGHDGIQAVELSPEDLTEKGKLRTKLAKRSIFATPVTFNDFCDQFMTAFMQMLQRARKAADLTTRCGWSEDFKQFVLGKSVYTNTGVSSSHIDPSAPDLGAYESAGEWPTWRAAFDHCMAAGPDRQIMLALSIGSPLMPFSGIDGVLLHVYSPESGVGKSTTADAALSIWGAPNGLRKDFRDTQNAVFKLAAAAGNMPMVLDEMTNIEGKVLSDYVYTLTQGREKKRMGVDQRVQRNDDRWCLAALATSNNSIHGKLQDFRAAGTAEAARVFEMRLRPLPTELQSAGTTTQTVLRSNYGFLGPAIAHMFVGHGAAYWRAEVEASVQRWTQFGSTVGNGGAERFRSVLCAVVEIGARIGVALGLQFDQQGIADALASHWRAQITEFEADRRQAKDYLDDYIARHVGSMIVMAGPKADRAALPANVREFKGEVHQRLGSEVAGDYDRIVIPVSFLRKDVVDAQGDWREFSRWLKNSGTAKHFERRKVFGATLAPITTDCVVLDFVKATGSLPKPALVKTDTAATAAAK